MNRLKLLNISNYILAELLIVLIANVIEGVNTHTFNSLLMLCLVFVGISKFVVNHYRITLRLEAENDLKTKLTHIYLEQEQMCSKKSIFEICSDDVERYVEYENAGKYTFLFNILFILFNLYQIYRISPMMVLVVLGIMLLCLLYPLITSKLNMDIYETIQDIEDDIASKYVRLLQHVATLQQYNKQEVVDKVFDEINTRYEYEGNKSEFLAQSQNFMKRVYELLSTFGVFFCGITLISYGLTLPALLAISVLGDNIIERSGSIFEFVKEFKTEQEIKANIKALATISLKKIDSIDSYTIKELCIPFVDKTISYDVTKGANYLLGENGAGKTTCIRCLLKDLEFEGHVEINNETITNLQLQSLISYIPQDQPHLDFDVNEIIRPETFATYASLLELQDDVYMKSFDNLSSGQRQKVMIMKALEEHKCLLIGDELENYLNSADVLDTIISKFTYCLLITHRKDVKSNYVTI